MTRQRVTEQQRYIDRVFISALAGLAMKNPQTFELERAYNMAEEAWELREERRRDMARRAMQLDK